MKKILIIDDDLGFQTMLKMSLEREPYQVSFASSGREAMELARQSPPDLILLDLMMPGENGILILTEMRADDHLKNVPCVVITGLNDGSLIFESAALALGAVEFLEKPFERADLLDAIQIAFGQKPSHGAVPKITKGDLSLDPSSRRVWVGGKFIGHLPPQRFRVLSALARADGAVAKPKLVEEAGPAQGEPVPIEETVDRLREDLLPYGHSIQSTPEGYKLIL